MNLKKEALNRHQQWAGKIEVISRVPLGSQKELSLAYTPGVAEPCMEIARDSSLVYKYTRKGSLVAVVTDGTAVLGLGDIGPEAALPVMEGKAALFKEFGGVDAVPVCLGTKDTEEIIRTVALIAPSFGGINLEDISAPRCFEIERRLKEILDIPVFHDDQHGTAVVCLAALLNALKVVKKNLSDISVVINGAGAAGNAVSRLLLLAGVRRVIVCGKNGALYRGMDGIDEAQKELARITNLECSKGSLAEVCRGADVLIGVSAAGCFTGDIVSSMAEDAVVFALANPVPEIFPDEAIAAGARIVATGRSDFSNQINNILAFPGIFKGALESRTKDITDEMKLAAAYAVAGIVSDDELCEDYIIPSPFDRRVADLVAQSVVKCAEKTSF